MGYLNFFLKLDRNPLLPILLALAAFVVLAPDFEVPQSSRIAHDGEATQVGPVID